MILPEHVDTGLSRMRYISTAPPAERETWGSLLEGDF